MYKNNVTFLHGARYIDVSRAKVKAKEESYSHNPYPEESATPTVKITPNNAPKGESATSITTRS